MFKPHCDYSIELNDNIMYCVMQGAWNIEGALEYFADVKQKAAQLGQNKWCRITETSAFEGGPLEIMQVLKDIQDWSLSNNCLCLYIVAPRSFNKMVIDKHKNGYEQVQYAETPEQAFAMARALLNAEAG